MRQIRLFAILFSFSLLFNACGSNSDTFTWMEKEFVHKLFLTEYLWYDQVASHVDYTQYTTRTDMVNDLRVTPPDIWSFTMSKDDYNAYVNQEASGFGFGYTTDFQIYMVRIDAPAYGKLFRGDRIVAINGQGVTTTLLKAASQNLNSATTFTLLREGHTIDVTVRPSVYNFRSTLGKVIEDHNTTVGYLRYDSFTETSVSELEDVFSKFKDANISQLVIDLRYNGGGSIAAASILLDNISNAQPGARQVYLDWNANSKKNNSTYFFSDEVDANDLDMKRVFFLVSKNTASASELVISALKPYLGESNVITIGTATHGKPVGMSGKVYGDNYYFLINFFVRNNDGDTTGFDGIPATCAAEDDLNYKLGDVAEPMLRSALDYIVTGTCF